jgi:Spx/MgsR family transcriptional regulator
MKKAFAWLEGNGIEYTLHDYKKEGAPPEKLKAWIKQLGWERIVNTKGTTFRQLPASRQQGLDANRAAALLAEFPSAIKRPILESGKKLLIGFNVDEYQSALG